MKNHLRALRQSKRPVSARLIWQWARARYEGSHSFNTTTICLTRRHHLPTVQTAEFYLKYVKMGLPGLWKVCGVSNTDLTYFEVTFRFSSPQLKRNLLKDIAASHIYSTDELFVIGVDARCVACSLLKMLESQIPIE